MLQMSKHYEPEFKHKMVRLHLEDGRTLKSLAEEYGVSKTSISIWVNQFRNECQTNTEAKLRIWNTSQLTWQKGLCKRQLIHSLE